MIDAKEAESIGLVNKVVSAGELDAVAEEWGRRLAAGPTLALGLSKRLLDASSSVTSSRRSRTRRAASTSRTRARTCARGSPPTCERREPRFSGS